MSATPGQDRDGLTRQPRFALPPGAAQLLLVRHGESAAADAYAADRPPGGQADPPLSPVGDREAELVAARLAYEPITSIYTSPLRRTAQTAAPLAERLGLTAQIDPDLREVFLGEVDGLNLSALASAGHAGVRRALREERWDLLPGAESQAAFSARVRSAIETIAGRHGGGVIAVFTHGGVIGEVLSAATGCRPHAFTWADNASVSHLVVARRRWIVRSFNDTSHLRTIVATV